MMRCIKMKQGYQKGEVHKRKIVETEIFSVDERIKIISGIIAIMEKKEEESMEDELFSLTFMQRKRFQSEIISG